MRLLFGNLIFYSYLCGVIKKKVEITINNMLMFRHSNNISTNEFKLLVEAFRRKHFLDTKPLPTFLGLGTPSQYKSKYFVPSFGKLVPRVNNWFSLSSEGLEVMKKMESHFYLRKPRTYAERLEFVKTNELLFNFQF